MLDNWKISSHQFRILVFLCFLGSSILLVPAGLAAKAKQDVWIAAILGIIIALILVYLFRAVGNRSADLTIIEFTEKTFGKWIGKTVSLLFIFYMFHDCALLVFTVGDFVTAQIMPETPIQFTSLLFVIVVVLGARLGLETFARAAEILYPWVIGLVIIFLIFLFPDLDFKNLQPIFEHGIKPNINGALHFASFSSMTLVVIMMIFPAYINNHKEANKSLLNGTLLAGLILFLIGTFCVLVLGADITSRNAFPSYALAKKISLGDFIQRIEVIIAIIWLITMFYKTLLFFFGTVIGIAQVFNLKDYRSLTLPLGMILVVFSLIVYPSSTYAFEWDVKTFPPYVSTFGFVFPLLLLIVSSFRNQADKKGK